MRLNVPIRLRWADLDAYGHVNNAEMLRLLEEARILALWTADDAPDTGEAAGTSTAVLDGRPGADTLSLIARQEIEYLAPIPYLRQPLDIQIWVGRLGGASLELCYEVWSPVAAEPATLYARAATTIVLVDAATGRPRRINERERAAWTPYSEPAIEFHRR
ncbi:acyl-CoA thioesterase [Humibacter ginsenosidimutans]|uniref:Acyl-CoA thioesterase n=1 Tax=Humibacter ginsenosidimutans TaxID=2599293 RepID=A0A5B8M191_9MICO|nr:thioesterase family protein [Humibacter ginsenosidimutans]QDZ14036.1 acyl-CoA thioesterase [Humibacter ginsenosidimutans]